MTNMIEQAFSSAEPEEGDCNSWCQSKDVDQLFAALVAFQGEAPNVIKKAKADLGKGGSWTYAPLSVVRTIMRPVLAKHCLGVLQLPHQRYDSNTNSYRVGVSTRLIHASGQWLQSPPMWCVPVDFAGAPSLRAIHFGSALTYARRYSYEATIGIVASKDDDGVAGSGLGGQARRQEEASEPTRLLAGSLACTQCGKPMTLRTGKKGSFYGCTGYPDCKNTLDAGDVPAAGNGVSTSQQPADTDKEARRKAWDAVKQIGQKHGLGDTELSLYVEALGRKVAGVPLDEIAAVGQLVPEVAKQWAEMKTFDINYRSPDGKHFVQLTREQRETVLASARRKEPVPF